MGAAGGDTGPEDGGGLGAGGAGRGAGAGDRKGYTTGPLRWPGGGTVVEGSGLSAASPLVTM